MGETVAVTGDGTNDAAALNEADVGFAMGISGTQIAMNASDIVILDDNFSSIVNAVRWGRNVYDGIRKFLQFQLSVNIVAILLTIVGSVVWGRAPLNSVQLLWVNLIMDSLGALALASDKPGPDILDQKPHSRHESMVSRHMWFYIASVVAYQLALLLALLFVGEAMVPFPAEEAAICTYDVAGLPAGSNWLDSCRGRWRLTVVFTTFILLQVFNELTTRQLEGELNPGRGLLRNRTFLLISVAIVGVQVLVVQFGGGFVGTVPLDWMQWLVAAAWASGLLVWIVGIRFLAKTYEVMPASRKAKKRVASDHPHPPAPAHATSSSPAAHLKPNQPSWVGEMESIKSSSRVFVRSKSSMALQSHPSPAPAMAPSPSTRRIAPEGPGDSIVEIPSAMATGHKKHIEHVSFHPDVSEPRLRSSKMSIKKSIEELAGRVFSDEAIEGLRGKKSLSKSGIPAALSKRPRGSGNLEEAALWDGEEVGMGKDGGSEV